MPDLTDTQFMVKILQSLGATAKFENGTLTVHAKKNQRLRGLRTGAENARFDLHCRPVAGAIAQGADFFARRLCHWRTGRSICI
ncbi:MAG: hypothetical protein WDM76_12255 [Limisphaerales bacterium]